MSRESKADQRSPKNTIALTDPNPAIHDSTAGYAKHSRWLNTSARREFVCMDPTPGSCLWDQINGDAGVISFLDLKDTPGVFTGSSGKVCKVSSGEDAIIFDDSGALPSGDRGDILIRDGASWVKLAIGTSSHVLQVESVGEGLYEPRWDSLPYHNAQHISGGGDEVVHQNLSGAGSNDHSAIDTHLGSTSNPHTVTAAQVGNSTAQWNADKLRGVNVHTAAPTDGQVLKYNNTDSRWEAGDESGSGASHNTIYADTYEVTTAATSATTKKTFDYITDSDAPATTIKLIVGLWMTGGGTATCTLELDDGTTTKSDTVTSTASAEEDIKKISIDITAATALLEDTPITVNLKLHRTGGTTAHMKFTEVRELFS